MTLASAKVPAPFVSLFEKAESSVDGYFRDMIRSPEKGEIRIGDERYVLVRGASLINSLIERMENQFGEEVMKEFLYDLAKSIGRIDAEAFAKKLNLQEPPARLSAGPVHFAYTGWAYVDILPESAPAPDDSYLLVYNHPNTFESEHYRAQGRRLERTTCHFSAGYSAGWCSSAFGIEVDAREITCTAKGDAQCRFVMAPPQMLEKRCQEMMAKVR